MSIYIIEEDCVIGCVGRWYKLDFELMSLCPRCFCFLLFIPCMSNFIVLSLFSSSLRFHFFFCLFEMRQIREHIRLQMEQEIM